MLHLGATFAGRHTACSSPSVITVCDGHWLPISAHVRLGCLTLALALSADALES